MESPQTECLLYTVVVLAFVIAESLTVFQQKYIAKMQKQ